MFASAPISTLQQRTELNLQVPPPAQQQQGLALRRGTQLFIRTDQTPHDEQQQQHTTPDTLVYKTSLSEPARPAPYETNIANVAGRRASKIGFKSIFRKSSALKPGSYETKIHIGPEHSEDADASQQQQQQPPYFHPQLRESMRPLQTKPKSKWERPTTVAQRPSITWDPPPLFQTQAQSVKIGTLLTPLLPADNVLQIEKERRERGDKTAAAAANIGEDGLQEFEGKKGHKRQPSTNIECTNKIFLLTTSGCMLQYSEEGSSDRLPERAMQLGRDSAAFASDALPGKHWVLHVSQTAFDEGVVMNEARKSVFPKFGLGVSMKRPVSNFLLVMGSAEEMEEWMSILRREIQQLGGKTLADETTQRDASLLRPIQTLRERPDKKIALECGIASHQTGNASPKSPHLRSHRSSIGLVSPIQSEGEGWMQKKGSISTKGFNANFPHPSYLQVSTPTGATRPGLSRRASSSAILQSPTTEIHQSPKTKPNIDKALPTPPSDSAGPSASKSPIDALGICLSPKGFGFAFPNQSANMSPTTANFPQSNKKSTMPVSAYNAERLGSEQVISLETNRDRNASVSSTESKRAMNFSMPRQVSHSRQNSGDRGTFSGSTTTSRARTPSLTDGESTRPDSIVIDAPNSNCSVQRSVFTSSVEAAVAMPMSPGRAEVVENKLPEIIFVPPEHRPAIPKRMSSLEYGSGQHPFTQVELAANLPQIRAASCSPRPERFLSSQVKKKDAEEAERVPCSPSLPPMSIMPAVPQAGALTATPIKFDTEKSYQITGAPATTSTSNTFTFPNPPATNLSTTPKGLQTYKRRPSFKHKPRRSLSASALQSPKSLKSAKSYTAFKSQQKLPHAAPMTIQERRKFLGRNNLVNLPPALPPPTTALPSLPPQPSCTPPTGPLPTVPGEKVLEISSCEAGSVIEPVSIQAPHANLTIPNAPLTPPNPERSGADDEDEENGRNTPGDNRNSKGETLLPQTRFDPRATSQLPPPRLPASPPQSTQSSPPISSTDAIFDLQNGNSKPEVKAQDLEKTAEHVRNEYVADSAALATASCTVVTVRKPVPPPQSQNRQWQQGSPANSTVQKKSIPRKQTPQQQAYAAVTQTATPMPQLRPLSPLRVDSSRQPEVNRDLPRSPVSESWATYLQRVGAAS